MENLINKKTVPHKGMKLLNEEEIRGYISQVNDWEVLENKKIRKLFKFKDFKETMEFVNKIAVIAEEEGHHPDIAIYYNKLEIVLWSHFVSGLSENDFILAAKIDKIL